MAGSHVAGCDCPVYVIANVQSVADVGDAVRPAHRPPALLHVHGVTDTALAQTVRAVWRLIPALLTDDRVLVALDDFINPKVGRKIFGCETIFDHRGMLRSGVWARLKKAALPVEIGLSRTETNREKRHHEQR